MLRLVSEVPVQEDTLLRVMIIGLGNKEFGISAMDALELADQLIRRAAMLHTEGSCSTGGFQDRQSAFSARRLMCQSLVQHVVTLMSRGRTLFILWRRARQYRRQHLAFILFCCRV